MVDPELARDAGDLLSTAIAEVLEDDHDLAVTIGPTGVSLRARADRLTSLGQDITVLAQAIGVLARRSARKAGR